MQGGVTRARYAELLAARATERQQQVGDPGLDLRRDYVWTAVCGSRAPKNLPVQLPQVLTCRP